MLTDEVKIRTIAGKGGDGAVAFDKIKMALGPTGGRGGNGGNVYFEGVSDLLVLRRYTSKKEHWAEDGKRGGANKLDGKNGEDLVLAVPVGSLVRNEATEEQFDITEVGQKILVAKGGIGGRGNFLFRSSTNTSPEEFEEGKAGEDFYFSIELRLIADAGLIGLPSAGKSSLLNELTKANAKTGAYHFTTLEPNLGVTQGGLILADIPGLIEGASAGRGLGIKFLRHIQRTKVLVHCLSLESEDLQKDYETIRKELGDYDQALLKKEEIIFLTKHDLVSEEMKKEKLEEWKKINPETFLVSIHDWNSIKEAEKILEKLI